ncbi:hypothetical protein LEN26_012360 [Aphanomyces euteiches]|nr:hypothetical protein LEN26_012360 [Aphanomyces euteiches]
MPATEEDEVGKPLSSWQSRVVKYEHAPGKLIVTVETPLVEVNLFNTSRWLLIRGGPGGIWKIHQINTTGCVLTCIAKEGMTAYPWELAPSTFDGENFTVRQVQEDSQVIECAIVPPLIAYCRTTIFNVFEINTVSQTFRADVYFEVRFRYIASLYAPQTWVEDLLQAMNIAPDMIECLNTVSIDGDIQRWTMYLPSSQHRDRFMDLCYKIRFKGCFVEQFELQEFPFDQQTLNISLTINQPIKHVVFRSNDSYPSLFMANNFSLSNVFEVVIAEHVFAQVTLSNPKESSSGYVYNSINFSIALKRKPGFYVSNVMAPISILTYLGFLSFGIESQGTRMATSSRLAISVTLLLTMVAYKFATAGALPQISYLTTLDRFVTYTSFVMCVIAIENAVFPWWCSDDTCFDEEQIVLWVLFGIFTVGIVVGAIFIAMTMKARDKENAILLSQHHLRLLVAKEHPGKPHKVHSSLYSKLLTRMGLPSVPEACQQKGISNINNVGMPPSRVNEAKSHLSAIAAEIL